MSTYAAIRNQNTQKVVGFALASGTGSCAGRAELFPVSPTSAELKQLTATPSAGQYRSLCQQSASRVTALWVGRNSDGSLSFYASGTGAISLTLKAIGTTPPYAGAAVKQMTTADGPYSRPGLFTGSAVYGSLFPSVGDGAYSLLVTDDQNGTDGYLLTVGGNAPLQPLKLSATLITEFSIYRYTDRSVSFYASGSQSITISLEPLTAGSSYPITTKVMTTADGPYSRPELFNGTRVYGSYFPAVPDGRYRVRSTDALGGTDVYEVIMGSEIPRQILKGAPSSPDPGSGGGTGTPTTTYQGKIDHISPSRRPDLMSISVTTYQESDGTWWMRFDDVATGGFEKYYRGIGPGSWLTLAQLRALRMPFGYLYAISCMQMSGPPDDSKINDQTAHCVQFIYGI